MHLVLSYKLTTHWVVLSKTNVTNAKIVDKMIVLISRIAEVLYLKTF